MVKVVIDVPQEKMANFLKVLVSLGIDKHSIRSQPVQHGNTTKKRILPSLTKFLLFDWEYFNNELEFE
jgi:hypothetical protein